MTATARKAQERSKKEHRRKVWRYVFLALLVAGTVGGLVLASHYARRANNPAGANDHSFVVPVWSQARDGSRLGIDFSAAKNAPISVNHANIVGQARLATQGEVEDAVRQNPSVQHVGTDYFWLLDGSVAQIASDGTVKRFGAPSDASKYGALVLIAIHTQDLAVDALNNAGFVADSKRVMPLSPFDPAAPRTAGNPQEAASGLLPVPSSSG